MCVHYTDGVHFILCIFLYCYQRLDCHIESVLKFTVVSYSVNRNCLRLHLLAESSFTQHFMLFITFV